MKILISQNEGIFQIAALTFAELWRKTTGESPEIITEDDPGSDLAAIGTDADSAFLHAKMVDGILPDPGIRYGSDEYRLLSFHDGGRTILQLAGGSPRAFLYAVYDYFERFAGCAYFWDGDRIPFHGKPLQLDGIDVLEKPRFEYRGLRYFAHRSLTRFQAEQWDFEEWKQELDWLVKKRLNFFMLRIGIDDLFQKAFPETVPYPELGKQLPEAFERSYDDRNLFWSLEYRGELRKKVLAYARERGLVSPEDCGTMTHWYSRTPRAFLDKIKPKCFYESPDTPYGQDTGLVFDITLDRNLEYYWTLTKTHIREYGSPEMFHTIGLAERGYFNDPRKNHEMKLYTYRRIAARLRKDYPHAPLLIGTWDFVSRWTTRQVQDLLNEFDPANTILFDYISDICDEVNNFVNWGVRGKFPWFFGIFHAFEASTDIRGNYNVIERRLPYAAEDPMCKGMVLWPENSHADTLMLEYLAANAWHPNDGNRKIELFLEKFLAERYGKNDGSALKDVWRNLLPLIREHYWRVSAEAHMREIYPDYMFNSIRHRMLYLTDVMNLENFRILAGEMWNDIHRATETFDALARIDYSTLNDFMRRDFIDLARTAALRAINFGIFWTQILMEHWRNGEENVTGKELTDQYAALCGMMAALASLLEAHTDFSMNDSLVRLGKNRPVPANFEHALKGNAETGYCRSFIYELFVACYLPEFDAIMKTLIPKIHAEDHSQFVYPESLNDDFKRIQDNFYATPLAHYAPNHEKAVSALPETLAALARNTRILLKRVPAK